MYSFPTELAVFKSHVTDLIARQLGDTHAIADEINGTYRGKIALLETMTHPTFEERQIAADELNGTSEGQEVIDKWLRANCM